MKNLLPLLALVAAAPFAAIAAEKPADKAAIIPVNADALKAWRDARFGMFIHWGPVSLTGHEIGWSRGKQTPVEEYDNLYKRFNPTQQVLQNLSYANSQKAQYQPHFGTYTYSPAKVAALMQKHGCTKGSDGSYTEVATQQTADGKWEPFAGEFDVIANPPTNLADGQPVEVVK